MFHNVARRRRTVSDHSNCTLGFKTRVRGVLQMYLYWLVLVSAVLLIGHDHHNMFWLVCFSLSQLCQLFIVWLGMPGVSLLCHQRICMTLATSCWDWHIPFELCEKLLVWPRALAGNVEVKWVTPWCSGGMKGCPMPVRTLSAYVNYRFQQRAKLPCSADHHFLSWVVGHAISVPKREQYAFFLLLTLPLHK